MKITEKLRSQLITRGDSQNQVHKATGLSRATVAAFLKGDQVHSETIDLIGEYLQASLSFTQPAKEPAKKSKPAK